ncbi:MAG: hypothetical protein ACFCD0_02840 [Gemmataceae bacterium]
MRQFLWIVVCVLVVHSPNWVFGQQTTEPTAGVPKQLPDIPQTTTITVQPSSLNTEIPAIPEPTIVIPRTSTIFSPPSEESKSPSEPIEVTEEAELVDEVIDDPTHGYLSYPYAMDMQGYRLETPTFIYDEELDEELELPLYPRSIQVFAETGTDFHDNYRTNAEILMSSWDGAGVLAGFLHVHRDLAGNQTDDIYVSKIAMYEGLKMSDSILRRAGGGMITLTRNNRTHMGWNAFVGFDVFPVKPVIISGLIEGGRIDDSALVHTRLTAGYLYTRFEVYAGYDYFHFDSVNVHAPIVGLRVWF